MIGVALALALVGVVVWLTVGALVDEQRHRLAVGRARSAPSRRRTGR